MPALDGVGDAPDGPGQAGQPGRRPEGCEARIDEALRIAWIVDAAGDKAARRRGANPQRRREPSDDLVIGGTQPELHARTLRRGYDIERPVSREIPGIYQGFAPIRGDPDYSSPAGASSAAAEAVVAAAGRRRAGAGPEYHFFEIHMKNGTARKIDE